jgi:hypothetical protein
MTVSFMRIGVARACDFGRCTIQLAHHSVYSTSGCIDMLMICSCVMGFLKCVC